MRAATRVTCSRACVVAAIVATAGCATWSAPKNTSDSPLRARATTQTNHDVQLSAAVLSREDGIRMFGTDLDAAGVQPVWVEIRNDTAQSLWLLRAGTDPDYFSPLEVAWGAHVTFGGETNRRIDEHFDQLAFHSPIPPGQTRSGILFTNPQPVTKLLNVDLLGDGMMIPFTLLMPAPGEAAVGYRQRIHAYADSDVQHCEGLASLRMAIEALPCCAADSGGAATGEPINMVIVGELEDVGAALARRGYRRDPDISASAQGSVAGSGRPGAAVEVFGRVPDLVVRKRAQAGASASWLRVWRAPITYREQPVFVAQAGRPVGGRFAHDAHSDRLHPDVDEVRNILIQDFLYSGGLAQLGFAKGVGAVPSAQPRTSPTGASYYTDGLRAVLFFATRPLTFADVRLLDWESLPQGAAAPKEAESVRQ